MTRLSAYTMIDLLDIDMACMKREHEEILNAYLVSTSEFKEAHLKLVAKTPEEAELFMLMIKRFTNLFLYLFSSSIPIYRKLK